MIKNMTTLNSKVEDTTMDGREVRSKFSQEVANQLEEEQVEKLFVSTAGAPSGVVVSNGADNLPLSLKISVQLVNFIVLNGSM